MRHSLFRRAGRKKSLPMCLLDGTLALVMLQPSKWAVKHLAQRSEQTTNWQNANAAFCLSLCQQSQREAGKERCPPLNHCQVNQLKMKAFVKAEIRKSDEFCQNMETVVLTRLKQKHCYILFSPAIIVSTPNNKQFLPHIFKGPVWNNWRFSRRNGDIKLLKFRWWRSVPSLSQVCKVNCDGLLA